MSTTRTVMTVGLSFVLCACGAATGLVDDVPVSDTGTPSLDSSVPSFDSSVPCAPTYQRPVDVLFVIDNSGSMREEQQSLRLQMPRVIRTLTSGISGDGARFVPVTDLHVGVVSTDLGLPGVPGRASLGCGDDARQFGDDGVLRNAPNPGMAAGLTCATSYPSFLSFLGSDDEAVNGTRITQIANDFGCIGSLGTLGCGFEQQLESALRSLWPSNNVLVNGSLGSFADDRTFHDRTMFGKAGPSGPNAGFLRNDPHALSLLAIVFVTDEEDCSSHNLSHFVPPNFLSDDDPLKRVGLNLRCFSEAVRVGGDEARDHGRANLYATARYVEAFKALRPGNEQLLVFAAIVGVPTDLVTATRIGAVDFTNDAARDGFYASLLADPRLLETPDEALGNFNPNLIPSCLRDVVDPTTGMTVIQKAYPPRRFIKVARELGPKAVIQSICQDDFTPAIDTLLSRIGDVIRNECPME